MIEAIREVAQYLVIGSGVIGVLVAVGGGAKWCIDRIRRK